MSAITDLENLYFMRDALMLEKQAQRDQIVPQEIREDLDALDAEYLAKELKLAERIEELEAAVKFEVATAGETMKGSAFMAVYTKGGHSVSAKDLFALADRWEKTSPEAAAEMRSIITRKKPSVSIQPQRNPSL